MSATMASSLTATASPLESRNVRDNTLIVYVTDNGWINRTAKATFDIGDDAALSNFRCELRKIDRFELRNEYNQRRRNGDTYGYGWVLTTRSWANGRTLTHQGSNTLNSSVAWVAPERDFVVLALTNAGGGNAFGELDQLIGRLLAYYEGGS